jgi:hypothetical protein
LKTELKLKLISLKHSPPSYPLLREFLYSFGRGFFFVLKICYLKELDFGLRTSGMADFLRVSVNKKKGQVLSTCPFRFVVMLINTCNAPACKGLLQELRCSPPVPGLVWSV